MLLSHVTLFIELNNVNNVNDVQAITNIKLQRSNLGLVEPSEVSTLLLLLKNNKDDLSTTTVLAFLFLFIVFFLKTKVKNKKGFFIFATKTFICPSRWTPNPTAKRFPQVQVATKPLKKFWQRFPRNLEIGKEGTAAGILFQQNRRNSTRETIKKIYILISTQEIDSVPKRKALSVGFNISIPPRSWRDSRAMSQPRWISPTKERTETKTFSKQEKQKEREEKKNESFSPQQISTRESKNIKPKRRFKGDL
jgi:hypothetical protein